LHRFRVPLERLAGQFVGTAEADLSVSDLVQEAWLRIWKGLPQFHGGATDEETAVAFYHWLRQTAWRTMLNIREARRTHRRHPDHPLVHAHTDAEPCVAAPEASPESAVANQEQLRDVQRAVCQLSDRTDRALMELTFWDGLSLRQIAEMLDLSYDIVRRRFHATLRQLARDLGDAGRSG